VTTVAIIDYGLCNLDSAARAVEECGGTARITADPAIIRQASRVILPGVGAFPAAVANLQRLGLVETLTDLAHDQQTPLLGICLGMQLLTTTGTEVGETAGLGLISGRCERLQPDHADERVPHIGWNEVHPRRPFSLLADVPPGGDFYFVHSYHVRCDDPANVVATTPFAGGFASVIASGNVAGVQFHPEKSQRLGFALLRSFIHQGLG
jgi:glutamine amidotransferase